MLYDAPQWLQEPPALVRGRRVLVVDEISSTGETLGMVSEKVRGLGAGEVRTAVLYAHTWGRDAVDYIALISDALLVNPWDREIVRDGEFRIHPEYVGALTEQGFTPGPSFLIPATYFTVAKSHGG